MITDRLACAWAGEADSTRTVSLAQIVEATLQNHLELALATGEEAARDERLAMARRGFLPAFSFGAGFFYLDGRRQGSFGELRQARFERFDPELSVALSWNLSERLHQVCARWHEYLASHCRSLDARRKGLLGIGRVYQSLVLTQAAMGIAGRPAEARRAIARVIQARVALQSGLTQAQAALAEAESQRVRATEEQRQANIRPAQALRWDGHIWPVPEEETSTVWPSKPELAAVKTRLQRLSDAAKAEAAAAKSQVEATKDHLPLAHLQLASVREYLQLAQERYQGSKALLLEVLAARTGLARAELDLATAASEYNMAQIGYLAALGALEPQCFPGPEKGL